MIEFFFFYLWLEYSKWSGKWMKRWLGDSCFYCEKRILISERWGSHAEIENLLWLLCLRQGAKEKVVFLVGLTLSKQKIGMVWHHRGAASPSFWIKILHWRGHRCWESGFSYPAYGRTKVWNLARMIEVIIILVQNEIEVCAIAGTRARFYCFIYPCQPPKQI